LKLAQEKIKTSTRLLYNLNSTVIPSRTAVEFSVKVYLRQFHAEGGVQ